MKTALCFISLIVAAALAGGCASAFTRPAAVESLPVLAGAASTNDSQVVAWLELAKAANKVGNPTPTQQPLDVILGAAVAVAGALGGWMTRHQLQKKVDGSWDEGVASVDKRPPKA